MTPASNAAEIAVLAQSATGREVADPEPSSEHVADIGSPGPARR
jgi:hypothetical protein